MDCDKKGVGDVGGMTITCAGGVGRYELSCQSPVSNAGLAMTAFSVTMGRPRTSASCVCGVSERGGVYDDVSFPPSAWGLKVSA